MKNIRNYENEYAVTSCGRVWSCKRQKFLTPNENGNGYSFVYLYKDGKAKKHYIHKLVLETYNPIDNTDKIFECNHIDENRENNCINNLEWLTHKDNCNHGNRNKRIVETRKQNKLHN